MDLSVLGHEVSFLKRPHQRELPPCTLKCLKTADLLLSFFSLSEILSSPLLLFSLSLFAWSIYVSFHGHKCQLAEMEGIRARLVLVEGLRSSSYDGRIEALASGQQCSDRALTMKRTFSQAVFPPALSSMHFTQFWKNCPEQGGSELV